MPLDCHFFSCGGEINAAKLLFNMFNYKKNYNSLIKIQTKWQFAPYVFLNMVNYFVMKHAKPILIEVKYINCNNLIVCIAIISNLYSSGSLVPS